jgi:hypothetical protein
MLKNLILIRHLDKIYYFLLITQKVRVYVILKAKKNLNKHVYHQKNKA